MGVTIHLMFLQAELRSGVNCEASGFRSKACIRHHCAQFKTLVADTAVIHKLGKFPKLFDSPTANERLAAWSTIITKHF